MNFKNILITFYLLSFNTAVAEPTYVGETYEINTSIETLEEHNPLDTQKINLLLMQKETLEKELSDNNIWSKIYSNYHTYKELEQQHITLNENIDRLEKIKQKTRTQKEELQNSQDNMITLLGKLQLLKEYEKDPFKKFLTPPALDAVPNVESPFAVIGALSYREKLQSDIEAYNNRYASLQYIVEKFKAKQLILKKLLNLDPMNLDYIHEQKDTVDQIKTFIPVLEIFKTTKNVHSKKIDEIELNLKNDIQREIERTVTIGAIILFFIFLLFFIKYFVKKYMSDNENFYAINKALNISFVSILLLTLLLAYIENVSYLVTILGFASAGIAIAMKDWFMSLLGWATIVLGGSIHVGDRVRFVRLGVEYVGDIVDISMLRMTMHEDINLTSFMTNRRAGRMIFIPNNFIFTDMIANYSHSGLKTVWDGIDFVITFDSDAHKATQIAKEVTKKYSKGYTEITRKQLNKLRSKYGMRNTNVEPRIYVHIEPYGMKISAWYLTNSYATMTLRSTISIEIISRIQAEEKIQLAFPTQSIYVDKNVPRPEFSPDDMHPNVEL
ncbi:MAG: mechanosensitive ion channel [Sulfurovum sp.]|uniref:mechanosensitive ion channel domain-containing protein n=1 Tax=Sulfurovum sp. TaxID=1969726 RepID=UPI0028682CEA|nr:mechanosensitive ion channel domain-containing protein [Sulfurovum sp.]MCO4845444.1 mechanosensitive ion channel [Sulfurovum sp.]